jgi:TonB family protein
MIGATLMLEGATGAATYTPAGKWVMDYQQDLCLLTRPFESNGSRLTFGLRQAPADHSVKVILLAANDPDAKPRLGILRTQLASSEVQWVMLTASRRVPGTTGRLMRFTLNIDDVMAMRDDDVLTLKEDDRPDLTLHLAGTAAALRALRRCERDQMISWGLDVSTIATLPKPVGSVADWFKFPPKEAVNRRGGSTTIRWMINTAGKVHDCTVVTPSGTAALDTAACAQVVKRGRYEPAIGKDGQPRPWIDSKRIIWILS